MASADAITPTVVEKDHAPVLSKEQKKNLQEITKRLHANLADTVSHLVDIGRDLIQAKELVGHGNFSTWLLDNFELTDQTARNFMHVASVFGDRVEMLKRMSLGSVYLLSAPSTSEQVRQIALQRVEDGEKLTRKDIQALREQYGDAVLEARGDKPLKESTFRSDVRKVNKKLSDWTEQLQKEWQGIDGTIGKKSKSELEALQQGLSQFLSTLDTMLEEAKDRPKQPRPKKNAQDPSSKKAKS